METRDIFICHAGEDKQEIVKPMVEAFGQAGITCWYDEAEIKWGDSITQKINEGLKISRYVIVVFSSTFIEKKWPKRELNAALNIEVSTGEVKVLPLIVGSESVKDQILNEYPLLNDKRYLPWDGDLRNIVKALLSRLQKKNKTSQRNSNKPQRDLGLKVPLPKIKKKFTQRDKDVFLRDAFSTIKDYFTKALSELENHYEEVTTDLMEIHNFKFTCTIYVRGEILNRCKIWLGGPMSSDAIGFQLGSFTVDSDNSYSDVLYISDDTESIGFKPSNVWFGGGQDPTDRLLNAVESAEYLWRRFTDNIR